ncbi:VCBS domain-containing protein [Thalassotalea agariperforans]
MKKQFLALSVIAALTACDSSDDKNTTQTAATFEGNLTAVLSKAENPALRVIVDDVNPGESLIFPATIEGTYGTFTINAAGDWDYQLYTGDEEHPAITALVSSDMPSLTEIPFVIKSADMTEQTINVTIEGIDVPAVFSETLTTVVNVDTGTINGRTAVSDANPAEAYFKAALEQPGAQATEVDGTATITTNYGVVTFTITDPVEGVEAVEASPAIPATETTPEIPAVEAVEGVAAVKGKVEWTYEIDASNEAVKALYYLEETDTPPTLDDSFTVESADGTTQEIMITLKGAQQIPADITGVPGGIDVEPAEGEEAVVNPDVTVNINSVDAAGTLMITDPNLNEDKFIVQDAVELGYGTFSIDENGAWTYMLDATNADVVALKGDGTAPTPLIETIKVMSVDGTAVDLPVTINGLIGGNLTAQIGGGAEGVLTLDVPDAARAAGKITFKANLSATNKNSDFTFWGDKIHPGGDKHRSTANVVVAGNGELKYSRTIDQVGSTKKDLVLEQSHTPTVWFDVEFTWNSSGNSSVPGVVSLSIDGVPVRDVDGEITSDFFDIKSLSYHIARLGVYVIQFKLPNDANAPLYIDDIVIYSDVAGTTQVAAEDFDGLAEGTELNAAIVDSAKSKTVIVGALAKPATE